MTDSATTSALNAGDGRSRAARADTPAAARARHRQSERRRRQDHDRDQSRHRARRHRRARADRRSRPAGQCIDRSRHRAQDRRHSTYDVLTGEASLRDAVLPTAVPRLSIAPSTLDLSGLELEIGQERDRAFRLRNALDAAQRRRSAGMRPISPMCWSTVRRRSICSPSTRWRRRTRSSCRCNASSSRSKVCRNC